MRAIHFTVVLVVLALSGCGDTPSAANKELKTMVAEEWQAYSETLPEPVGGLSLYVTTPQKYYFAATGIENASPATHFRIASNTKTFTAAAVLLLQQEGKLSIDDYVTTFIPNTSMPYLPETDDYAIPYKDQITIRQLLSHRAGVFDIVNNYIPETCPVPSAGTDYPSYMISLDGSHTFSLDELVGVVARCQLSFFPPGTDYHYSNTGYTLLAKIIERVSGMAYGDFIRERLLIPNGLFNTTVPTLGTDTSLPSPFAPGFVISEGEVIHWTEDNMSANIAEGNMISTPSDLARWIRLLLNGKAGLTKASIVEMTTCASDTGIIGCYGLGMLKIGEENPIYGHNGCHEGYFSLMLYDPTNDISTIIFSNLTDYDNQMSEMNVQFTVRERAYQILGY